MVLNLENTLHFHQLETPKNRDPVASKKYVTFLCFPCSNYGRIVFCSLYTDQMGGPSKTSGLAFLLAVFSGAGFGGVEAG